MLKPKPLWLQQVTPSSAWVTLAPHIYYPTYVTKPELYPDIIAHEKVHIYQQTAMGLKKWLSRYLLDRKFRVRQECQAAAAQIDFNPEDKEYVIKTFETMLNTSTYFYCCVSPETVRSTIERYLSRYQTVKEDPKIKRENYLDNLWLTSTWHTTSWASRPSSPDFGDPFYYPNVSPLVLSNSKGRRVDEEPPPIEDFDSWYQGSESMDSYLNRY